MIFSYNWLKDYVKLPKPDKLAEILTMHSFEVEEVKKSGKDWILDIDVLPDRAPDCFSHIGIAREVAAISNLKIKELDFKTKESKEKAKDFISIEIKDKNDCSRYTARVMTDVKVGPSPKWIQERLKVCGLRPINNIVDIANYVMLESGQPLHAFDLDKIDEKKIIVRRAKKGEKIVSLDDQKYDLDEDILIIADKQGPLAIAGIKGGRKAEIGKNTKTIVLESANFDSKIIRQASKNIGLRTDASWRFENGIDPNLTETAINRLAYLIAETAKAKTAAGLIDFYPKKALTKKIRLNQDYIRSLLGQDISLKEIKDILIRLGFKVKGGGEIKLEVEVPSFRLDISIAEDLIEEIGRIYSYDRIPAVFPVSSLIPPKRNFEIFWEDMSKNILKEAGFSEVYNYSFIGDKEANTFKYSDAVELENPISLDYKYLRPSLIPNLIKNVESNFKYFDKVKIFELGKIFSPEKRMLTCVIAQKHGQDAFYELKGIIDLLLNKLGISDISYDDYEQTPEQSSMIIWDSKRSAEIKVGGEEIGFLGDISKDVLNKIKGEVALFDIDFEKLQQLVSEEHEYQPISQHPSAVRDIAVLVPHDVKVVDVLNRINNIGGKLIRDIDLFDIYHGEEISQGKKNLAFHIIYQAEDRTLTAKEIDKIQNKIIKTLEKDPEWEVRT